MSTEPKGATMSTWPLTKGERQALRDKALLRFVGDATYLEMISTIAATVREAREAEDGDDG